MQPEHAVTRDASPPTPPSPVSLRQEWLIVTLFFVALSLVYLYPLWLHPGTYLVTPGDPLQHISIQWWTSTKLLSGNWTGMWDLPPYFYPAHNSLAFGDPQFGTTVTSLPLFAATRNIVLAYNFMTLISVPLCALGMYALAREVTKSRIGAILAGVIWGYGIWHSGQAGHQQILSLEALPFLLLALHRYGRTRNARYLIGLFFAWLAQEFFAEYWGAFLLLAIAPCAFLMLCFTYRLPWRNVLAALLTISLAVLPWLIAQRPLLAMAALGYHHRMLEVLAYSADLSDYLPQPGSLLWGHWGPAADYDGLVRRTGGEYQIAPGLLTLLLAAAGCVLLLHYRRLAPPEQAPEKRTMVQRVAPYIGGVCFLLWAMLKSWGTPMMDLGIIPTWITNATVFSLVAWVCLAIWYYEPRPRIVRHQILPQDARSPVWIYLALTLLSIAWSCGYSINYFGTSIAPGLLDLLSGMPGAHSFRVLTRMGAIADLGLAMLAAYGLGEALRRWKSFQNWQRPARAALLAVLCGIALAENIPQPGTGFFRSRACLPPARAVDRWLAGQPTAPAVELPLTTIGDLESERMYYQTVHHKPIMNGAETFFRHGYFEDAKVLKRLPSPKAIALLRKLGIRYVLVDRDDRYGGARTMVGAVPFMPTSLPPPFVLRFDDPHVRVYELPPSAPSITGKARPYYGHRS